MRFDGKVGVVTGGASGIGRATAIGFAQRGGAVVIADFHEDGGKQSRRGNHRRGRQSRGASAPMSARPRTSRRRSAWPSSKFGRLDFIHNNAFAMPPGWSPARTGDTADEHWDHTLNVGLTACFRGMKAAIAIMREQKSGSIVNTASISGLHADYGIAAYNTVKAALINLTRAVALEYGPVGIRANCVCPGVIDTPLLGAAADDPGGAAADRKPNPAGTAGAARGHRQRGAVPGFRPRRVRQRSGLRRRRRPDRAHRHSALHAGGFRLDVDSAQPRARRNSQWTSLSNPKARPRLTT